MKRTSILILVLSLTLFALCSCASTEVRETGSDSGAVEGIAQIFPAENAGDSSYNTGESHLSVLKFSGNNMITSFRFEKGARNYWHSHPDAEQTLMILSGEAYYQEEGQPKQLLRAGDVVVTAANVKHWNGATENSACTCLTVSEKNDKEHAVWYAPVSDEEFVAN